MLHYRQISTFFSPPKRLNRTPGVLSLLLNGLGRAVCVAGMAPRYRLDTPVIESQWGEIFRTRPDRPWGPPSDLYNEYRVSFPVVKLPGRGVDHPPPSSAEVKEKV